MHAGSSAGGCGAPIRRGACFEIAVSSGRVSEIKLRCERQYVFFRYEPGVQYKVDGAGGTCGIELVGDPGTAFELIQS
jgi:hypothetical protein